MGVPGQNARKNGRPARVARTDHGRAQANFAAAWFAAQIWTTHRAYARALSMICRVDPRRVDSNTEGLLRALCTFIESRGLSPHEAATAARGILGLTRA